MLAKSEQINSDDIEVVYVEVTYRFRCKQCRHVYSDWDKYIKHANLTRHMGTILQVITHDKLIELP